MWHRIIHLSLEQYVIKIPDFGDETRPQNFSSNNWALDDGSSFAVNQRLARKLETPEAVPRGFRRVLLLPLIYIRKKKLSSGACLSKSIIPTLESRVQRTPQMTNLIFGRNSESESNFQMFPHFEYLQAVLKAYCSCDFIVIYRSESVSFIGFEGVEILSFLFRGEK